MLRVFEPTVPPSTIDSAEGAPPRIACLLSALLQQMSTRLFQDYDAVFGERLVAPGDRKRAVNHIPKAQQRAKGVEVLFDPKEHK